MSSQAREIDQLLDAVGVLGWEYDWASSSFTFVSDACERLLGYTREEWLTPGFWGKRVHPDDFTIAAEYCRQSTIDGRDHVFEYRMVHKDGHTVWVRDFVAVDADKRLHGALRGVLVDITDTKRRAEHFDAVFRLMHELFFRVDRDGVILDYTAPDEHMLYVSPHQFLGSPLQDVVPYDAAAVLKAGMQQAAATGQMAIGQYSLTLDGNPSEWEARFLPLSEGDTAIVCRDVTRRNRRDREILRQRDDLDKLLAELKSSEARFRSVIERAPIGMHLYERRSDELSIIGANDAADRILRIEHAPLIGRALSEALPGIRGWVDVLTEIADGDAEWHAELPFYDDEVKGVFDFTAFQTVPGQVAAMFLDITERKAIEQADREHNRRVSALAAQIASAEDVERRRLAEELHDRVSQPLAVARMRLKAAADACPEFREQSAEATHMLEQAIRETRIITTELYPPVLAELGLSPTLEWLADEFGRLHRLSCVTQLEDVSGLADELSTFLFRSARELLMNVVKHACVDRAWLSLDQLGDDIALTVADEGIGFDPVGTDQPTAGSGFGLFSIEERIRYFGGKVDIESERGEGSRITITVPSHAGRPR